MSLAGIALDLLGFVFDLVALRHLPLFLVQAALASSLAMGAVCPGLAGLGASAGAEGAVRETNGFYAALPACLVTLRDSVPLP